MNPLPLSVRLYLLNAPRLEGDGAPLAVNRRKAVALLAYLALTGQTHLRDSLATLLWPDSGQPLARANLRHTLVILKQLLGDHCLDIQRDSIALKQEAALWVDVLHFQALLASSQSHDHAPNDVCLTCLPLLLEAVVLPVEQFMVGFTLSDSPAFDDWQRTQQQQLLQTLSDALERLVRYFIRTSEYKSAIDYTQRRLRLDTLDEAAHRRLMQLYAWSGQQGLALRQFELCTAILEKELGISPSAETVRLMQEIATGSVTAPTEVPQSVIGGLQRPEAESGWQPVETPQHNLPMCLPTLIGRDDDLQALQEMVLRGDVNLVTLVGPGGVGKTQLSLQLASTLLNQFADGVFFISLAPLREAELVITALAQTWDLPRQSNRPLLETVQSYLRTKQMLLILDNFDHLMAAAPLVSKLLANCAHLRIAVTSRELLNVRSEHLYPVAPLSLPKRGEVASLPAVSEAAAVQLFVQRAQALMPGFVLDETNSEDIAKICIHLDGLPLAIELVAARIRLLPPRILRLRLQESIGSSFELLQGGARDAPVRHRTLKDAIAWSYNLLTAAEQRLLRLISIFVGGCTFEAVERINEFVGQANSGSVLELLTSLVNKSLVQQVVQPDGEIRLFMLEMIREYGLEQSQVNGDFAVATHAHAETYAIFAESAMSTLPGPDQLAWIARLNLEQDNCRAALRWAITHQHAELAMRLGGTLWSFWLDRGYYHEGREFLVAILQLAGSSGRTPNRARVLTGLGALSRAQGDMSEAHAYLREAISIYREWGDEREIATALARLTEGCHLDFALPDYHQLCTEAAALYEKLDDRASATRIRHHFGLKEYREGNYKAAQAIFEESLAIFEEQQYETEMGDALFHLGRSLFQQQKFAEADQRFAETLSRAQARGDQKLAAIVLYFRGRVAYYQAEYAKAKSLLEESLHINRELGTNAAKIVFPLAFLSDIALAHGDVAAAQSMLREGLPLIYQEHDTYAVSLVLPYCANLAVIRGKQLHAVQLVAAGHSLYHSIEMQISPNDQKAFDAPLGAARRFLLPEDFARAWAAGERMTMAEAVALALAEITDHPSSNGTPQQSEAHYP